MGFIDAHVHVWTDDRSHYPLAEGFKADDIEPKRFTPQDLFKHTRPAGVDRVVLIQMSFYGTSNAYMLDMIALYPEVFVGTAVIDPHQEAPEKQMAELGEKGIRAFRIHPRLSRQPPAKWLEPEGYGKMFAAAARNHQPLSCLIEPDGLPEVVRMCKKFPETPVIIDHLCRIGANGPITDQDVDALCALSEHKQVMVKVGAFYALGKKEPPYSDLASLIQKVVKAFGPRRCMWESDCPFQVAKQKYADSIDLVKKRLDFLTEDDREWLLGKTAERCFFAKK